MNYEEMSDFGLNAALTCLVYKLDGWEFTGSSFFHCGHDGEGYHSQSVVDYCTDWNETMPLAVEYGISMNVNQDCSWDVHSFEGGAWIEGAKNPLRAIVICLIEVFEDKCKS